MMNGQVQWNVGNGINIQTSALLVEQIRIGNLKLPKCLKKKNTIKNQKVHWIIRNIDFKRLQCSIGTLQPIEG